MIHPWRGRSRPAQASLPIHDPEAVIGERHPQIIACETFLGHPVRRFDGVRAEEASSPSNPWARSWQTLVEGLEPWSEVSAQGEQDMVDGLVWHLVVDRGEIRAIVLEDQLYAQRVKVTPMTREVEAELIEICRGRVDEVGDLLGGRLPDSVVSALGAEPGRLMPEPSAFDAQCTCLEGRTGNPCRHVSAVLWAMTARIEARPRALFRLRGTDPEVLKGLLPSGLSASPPPPEHLVPEERLAEIFVLELDARPAGGPLAESLTLRDPLDVFLDRPEPEPEPEPELEPDLEPATRHRTAPAPSIAAGGSWLDDDWDDDDDDGQDELDVEVFGGSSPSPVSVASDAEGEEVLEIGRSDLLDLGLPSHRIQRWLADGTLLRTDKRGRYQLTPEAWAEIEPLLESA